MTAFIVGNHPCTRQHPFGQCDAGHPPIFSVNPNITAHDALVHVALYLRGAYASGYKSLDHMSEKGKDLCWANLHSVEMAQGLVEAMLEGIESQSVN